jgi:two-component system, chemotaxis family, sensor kinase CheA
MPAMNPNRVANNPARILVVDDARLIRTLVSDMLRQAGFHVFSAADGQEAWEILQQEKIDLIVTDVNMPHLDGLALTQKVRASRQWALLPVVLMSATDIDIDRQRGLAYGASAYVAKERQELQSLVQKISELLS